MKVRGQLKELILFLYHIEVRDQTQITRLVTGIFTYWSHLVCLILKS